MKKILWIFLLAYFHSSAQTFTFDTLPNAKAYINSFSLLPFTGTTKSGDIYVAGFNQHINANGKADELELVRIDLTTKKVQYKKITGFTGGKGYYWTYTFDNSGNLYLSMFYPTKKVLQLNLKDSIAYKDIGNPFRFGSSVIYSMGLGADGNVYFGGSIAGTFWSEYNPTTQQMEKHPLVDASNVYVLTITGDKDFAYMQTGQQKANRLWAVNKKTNEKTLLFSIPNTTRFDLRTFTDGIYAGLNTDTLKGTFKLINGKAVKADGLYAKDRREISGNVEQQIVKARSVTKYFDAVTSQVYFSFDVTKYDSIFIRNNAEQTTIRKVFSFPNDANNIYYVGEYYGNYYRYNLKERKSYLLGSTGYNIYSFLALNDSMMYMAGYPSGYIMLYNKNKPWTTQKFINGKIVAPTDANANPKILHYWKSEGTPAAGFHHTYQLLQDSKGNLIGAGDVIRIGNAASIGVFNAKQDRIYGINYEPFNSFVFSGIALWKDVVIYSMRSTGTRKPKLYFYDPTSNAMKDSIDLGFDAYGKIYIQNNILTGVANNRIYSFDLAKRKLIYNYSFPANSISGSCLLHNGTFLLISSIKIPAELKHFANINLGSLYETENGLYGIEGKNLIHVNIK